MTIDEIREVAPQSPAPLPLHNQLLLINGPPLAISGKTNFMIYIKQKLFSGILMAAVAILSFTQYVHAQTAAGSIKERDTGARRLCRWIKLGRCCFTAFRQKDLM